MKKLSSSLYSVLFSIALTLNIASSSTHAAEFTSLKGVFTVAVLFMTKLTKQSSPLQSMDALATLDNNGLTTGSSSIGDKMHEANNAGVVLYHTINNEIFNGELGLLYFDASNTPAPSAYSSDSPTMAPVRSQASSSSNGSDDKEPYETDGFIIGVSLGGAVLLSWCFVATFRQKMCEKRCVKLNQCSNNCAEAFFGHCNTCWYKLLCLNECCQKYPGICSSWATCGSAWLCLCCGLGSNCCGKCYTYIPDCCKKIFFCDPCCGTTNKVDFDKELSVGVGDNELGLDTVDNTSISDNKSGGEPKL